MGCRPWLRWSLVVCSGVALGGCQNPAPRSTYGPLSQGQQVTQTPPPRFPTTQTANGQNPGAVTPGQFTLPTNTTGAGTAPFGTPATTRTTANSGLSNPGGLAGTPSASPPPWPTAPAAPTGLPVSTGSPSMAPAGGGRTLTSLPSPLTTPPAPLTAPPAPLAAPMGSPMLPQQPATGGPNLGGSSFNQ